MDDFKTQEEKDAYSKKLFEESRKEVIFYDKVFRCFIDSIEDLSGYGLHSQGTDALIGDYIVVNNADGENVGAISTEVFDRLRHEIENFSSYSLNLLIKKEMGPLPNSTKDGKGNG